MNIWNTYYIENQKRQEQIEQAAQYSILQSAKAAGETRFAKLSYRMLEFVGSKMVLWGSRMQRRRVGMSLSRSKRAI